MLYVICDRVKTTPNCIGLCSVSTHRRSHIIPIIPDSVFIWWPSWKTLISSFNHHNKMAGCKLLQTYRTVINHFDQIIKKNQNTSVFSCIKINVYCMSKKKTKKLPTKNISSLDILSSTLYDLFDRSAPGGEQHETLNYNGIYSWYSPPGMTCVIMFAAGAMVTKGSKPSATTMQPWLWLLCITNVNLSHNMSVTDRFVFCERLFSVF